MPLLLRARYTRLLSSTAASTGRMAAAKTAGAAGCAMFFLAAVKPSGWISIAKRVKPLIPNLASVVFAAQRGKG